MRTGGPPSVLSCTAWGFSASRITPRAVSSYLAFSPLPVPCCQRTGGVFSVTLSVTAILRPRCPRVLRGMPPYGVRTFLWPALRLTSDRLPSVSNLPQLTRKETPTPIRNGCTRTIPGSARGPPAVLGSPRPPPGPAQSGSFELLAEMDLSTRQSLAPPYDWMVEWMRPIDRQRRLTLAHRNCDRRELRRLLRRIPLQLPQKPDALASAFRREFTAIRSGS